MSGELEQKLLAATGTLSLQDERRICSVLEHLKWTAVHGPFYVDGTQAKDREIDVVGYQFWKRDLKRGEERYHVHMIVEAKTMKDYHILASAPRRPATRLHETRYWLGYDREFMPELKRRLRTAGVDPDTVVKCSTDFANQAFPEGHAVVRKLLRIEPPPAQHVASTFRETNTSNERDLDSSVLWKASVTLRAAFRALVADRRDYHSGWIATTDEADLVHLNLDAIDKHVRMVDYFLPIVVIRSHLWMVGDATVTEIPWFRFVQLNHRGTTDWWFDVVREDYFKAYAAGATRHYSKELRQVKATRDSAGE